jgi:hypothetical protein
MIVQALKLIFNSARALETQKRTSTNIFQKFIDTITRNDVV